MHLIRSLTYAISQSRSWNSRMDSTINKDGLNGFNSQENGVKIQRDLFLLKHFAYRCSANRFKKFKQSFYKQSLKQFIKKSPIMQFCWRFISYYYCNISWYFDLINLRIRMVARQRPLSVQQIFEKNDVFVRCCLVFTRRKEDHNILSFN